ncbi:uncharacterized protein LOC119931798 [Tachyglossus aculeatus]|uniref:uncharacterized protein LOC119931798 n=1 Tax=Tachyglossus aculeatus TaxID=9261 RepID=UPI0018F52305|nr:uncharacterized protein LOC119931798 [Tachyglossus aculeatus]
MKSSGLFPLAVILALGTLQVSWAQTVNPKPGSCPPDNIRCIQAEPDQCKGDQECAGMQKCCYARCGLKCKDPQGTTDSHKVKAGQDPRVTVWPGIRGTKKGQDKVKPKPGSCPPDNIRCIQAEPDQCKGDQECAGMQKCCYARCGLKCKDPQGTTDSHKVKAGQDPRVTVWPGIRGTKKGQDQGVVKEGSCPVVNIRCAMLNPPDRCRNDYDCGKDEKCCEGACGKACVRIERTCSPGRPPAGVVQEGRCPVVNIRCAMLNPPDRCRNDYDCGKDEKCCEGACGKACVRIERSKKLGEPADPPPAPRGPVVPSDPPVGGVLLYWFPHFVQHPYKRRPPPTRSLQVLPSLPMAALCCHMLLLTPESALKLKSKDRLSDSQLLDPGQSPSIELAGPDTQQLWNGTMASSGLFPLAVILVLGTLQVFWAQVGSQRPGSCPLNHGLCYRPTQNQCETDQECSRGRKCCIFHCGRKCVMPRLSVVQEGSCPVVNIRCAMLNPPDRCRNDYDCGKRQKCCEGACGKACVRIERN